ncbi:amino acid dehydrogenase [Chromatiales bacterium (ex Bugula neritina AB1)]|nr:amino acid dehydrogenase [Chromatiales bacterium (ex Bugula neritina AB1)]
MSSSIISVADSILTNLTDYRAQADANLDWIKKEMSPYFLNLNKDEVEALTLLTMSLDKLETLEKVTLVDRKERLVIAQLSTAGSIYRTIHNLPDKPLRYAEITTSFKPMPDSDYALEVLRYDYRLADESNGAEDDQAALSDATRNEIAAFVKKDFPDFTQERIDGVISVFCDSNLDYVLTSPPERVARVMRNFVSTQINSGIHLNVEPTEFNETRVSFGVTNPPHAGFLQQVLEVFQRLEIGVKRAYHLSVTNGLTPYFLANFYVKSRDDSELSEDSSQYINLKRELYSTQITSTTAPSYATLIKSGIMSGPDSTLISAIVGFCHTNLAHNAPEIYDRENIARAFHNNPGVSIQLVELFYARFDPGVTNREEAYAAKLESVSNLVENFNSGRRILDDLRRTVFRCALSFIKNCLKSNFFVIEKHALSFRLDPHYLEELGTEFTDDLPAQRPFRITFFSGRRGTGFHIGFSDIARGGWRTVITQNGDDYTNNASTLFRENYVLAHTQHLKNKDIYEGGSKMVAILNIDSRTTHEQRDQYLYKLQHAFANAFLDLFVTDENGKAKDPRVVDYYGQEEPIELGPDENMHNVMIERMAKLAERRGYLLGKGIMSSKEIGINHKEYGVTSIGVIRFAEVIMQELGVNMHTEPFSVKFSGGPNGDVAGNGMRLLLERCPKVAIKLIVDGTGALFDPDGLDKAALSEIVLHDDIEGYNPESLHVGGFILYRMKTRKEGISDVYKKLTMTDSGLEEEWVSTDKFYKIFNNILFTVQTDLFIPAGGRPETLNEDNVDRYFDEAGVPSSNVIVEGANSFITPAARQTLQQRGVVIMRDASANKCGVISSSYEIIANLVFSDEEFLANKDEYVSDVIEILNEMAEVEARAVIRKHRELDGSVTYTEISSLLSQEINNHYARMFNYFEANPEQLALPKQQKAMLAHMPKIIRNSSEFGPRIQTQLPEKVKYAILASKLASGLVYAGDDDSLYGDIIEAQLGRVSS